MIYIINIIYKVVNLVQNVQVMNYEPKFIHFNLRPQ